MWTHALGGCWRRHAALGRGRGEQAGLPGPAVGAPSPAGPVGLGHLRGGPLVAGWRFLLPWGSQRHTLQTPAAVAAAAPRLESGLRGWRARPRGPVPPQLSGVPARLPHGGGVPPRVLALPEKPRVCSGRPSAVQSSARGGVWAARGAGLRPPCHPRARPGLLPGSPSLSPAAGGGPRQGACKWVQTPLIQGTPPRFAIVTPTGLYEFLKL